jgi:hypothetical protein
LLLGHVVEMTSPGKHVQQDVGVAAGVPPQSTMQQ